MSDLTTSVSRSTMVLPLKAILDYGNQFGWSDIEIIKKYLTQDGIGAEAIDVITEAFKAKIRNVETDLQYIHAQVSTPTPFYYHDYDEDTAWKLDALTRYMQMNLPFTEEHIKWMKKIKVKEGTPMWHDLAEAIKGIKQKDYKPTFFNRYTAWEQRGKR